MNKYLLTLSAVALLIVASCSKKIETPKEEIPTTCRLEQSIYKSGNDNALYTYTYDANGRIATVIDGFGIDTYSYSAIEIKVARGTGNITYKLDANNRIVSENSGSGYTRNYSYNTDGYLSQTQYLFNGNVTSTEAYSYTNGNLTSITKGANKVMIEYNSEQAKDNFFMDEVDSDLPLVLVSPMKRYFGKQSTNMVSKTIDGTYSETFTYTKDGNGNFIRVAITNNNGQGYTLDKKYTCK